MTDSIRDKIRKLLDLAKNDGATEAEAETAMRFASALIMKHGIEESSLKKVKLTTGRSETKEVIRDEWELWCAQAAGDLYSCRIVCYRGPQEFVFVGREANRDAALDTFGMIVAQVEKQYKIHLPRGLSKSARAEYRRTFKEACALRVYHRAKEVVQSLLKDEEAIKSTGSTALVIVAHRKELEQEIADFFANEGVRIRSRPSRMTWGSGSEAGRAAGNNVKLNRSI